MIQLKDKLTELSTYPNQLRVNTIISIITLNVDGINDATER